MTRSFILRNANDCRTLWTYVQRVWVGADPPVEVKVGAWHHTRSSEQNRRLWAMLDELSVQVNWHGNKLTAENWKDVLTASLKKQSVVPGIDGSFVVLGARTSRMTVAEMTELMDLIEAFGAQQGVVFEDERVTT